MVYQRRKQVQIIAASSPDEFEKKLNKALAILDEEQTDYELQFNHNMGYCAYIVSKRTQRIPEDLQDEFELAGEKHVCGDCPFWQIPDKGNVKYTRCPITAGIHKKDSPCCEKFYEMLLSGDIDVRKEGE